MQCPHRARLAATGPKRTPDIFKGNVRFAPYIGRSAIDEGGPKATIRSADEGTAGIVSPFSLWLAMSETGHCSFSFAGGLGRPRVIGGMSISY